MSHPHVHNFNVIDGKWWPIIIPCAVVVAICCRWNQQQTLLLCHALDSCKSMMNKIGTYMNISYSDVYSPHLLILFFLCELRARSSEYDKTSPWLSPSDKGVEGNGRPLYRDHPGRTRMLGFGMLTGTLQRFWLGSCGGRTGHLLDFLEALLFRWHVPSRPALLVPRLWEQSWQRHKPWVVSWHDQNLCRDFTKTWTIQASLTCPATTWWTRFAGRLPLGSTIGWLRAQCRILGDDRPIPLGEMQPRPIQLPILRPLYYQKVSCWRARQGTLVSVITFRQRRPVAHLEDKLASYVNGVKKHYQWWLNPMETEHVLAHGTRAAWWSGICRHHAFEAFFAHPMSVPSMSVWSCWHATIFLGLMKVMASKWFVAGVFVALSSVRALGIYEFHWEKTT